MEQPAWDVGGNESFRVPLPLSEECGDFALRISGECGDFAWRWHVTGERVAFLHLHATDCWRLCAFVSPTNFGVNQSWYLGSAYAANLQFGIARGRFTAPISITWYPIAGLEFSCGLDLLRWQPTFSTTLVP
jgi:hypothetical protein